MFNILNIAYSGMRAAQTHIATGAHNIANANTPGFRRLNVQQAEVAFRDSMNRTVGAGVRVTDVSRGNSPWLDGALEEARGRVDALSAAKPSIDRLSNLLSDPKLANAYDELYGSLSALSAFPSEGELQQDVVEKANNFAKTVNELNADFTQLNRDISNEIAFLSEENRSLFEQRDLAVRSNDEALLEQTNAQIESVNTRLNSLRNTQTQFVIPAQNRINEIVAGTVDALNSAHSAGANSNGNPTGSMFENNNGVLTVSLAGANDVSVTNVDDLYGTIDSDVGPNGPFTRSHAIELVKVGSYARQLDTSLAAAESSYQRAADAWQAEFGVSLEDEYFKIKQHQIAYDFNAMVMKTADQMLGTLLNIRA